MGGRNYRDLMAWQKGMDLAAAVYRLTAGYPSDERFGLTAQMRSAAVSIPSNIAEGQGRRTSGAFRQHLSIAHGSVRELETQVLLSERLGYLEKDAAEELLGQTSEVGRLTTALSNALRD